ncbi:MAG: hypothetical protein QF752_13115 [Planctomycetota bacterium]|jgi:poly(A) polymerase|nr:hypothetical protein [Planctomycetota bacterium]
MNETGVLRTVDVSSSDKFQADCFDSDSLGVVERIQDHGFSAYFVGGCVRDHYLGKSPNDYDVVSNATLRQIRRMFRNSRIIGRRHRLIHVYFGHSKKVVEVSSFLSPPEDETESVGTEESDACRRDFSINGLFYDPSSQRVIDRVGGVEDLDSRLIRSIGDPWDKFEEDPVRIIRGIRYASILGFDFEENTWDAMEGMWESVGLANKRRMQEELFKFLYAPRTDVSFETLDELGIFELLFPQVSFLLSDPRFRAITLRTLSLMDKLSVEELSQGFVLAVFMLPLLESIEDIGEGSLASERNHLRDILYDTFAPLSRTYSLSRKSRFKVRLLLDMQLGFLRGPDGKQKRILRIDEFAEGLQLFSMYCQVHGLGSEMPKRWADLYRESCF